MTDTTELPDKIGGVIATAPLFKGAPVADLVAIVAALSNASYHYADDSAKEWGTAKARMDEAAALANKHALPFYALQCLHRHTPQLVGLDDFVNAVLSDARNAE